MLKRFFAALLALLVLTGAGCNLPQLESDTNQDINTNTSSNNDKTTDSSKDETKNSDSTKTDMDENKDMDMDTDKETDSDNMSQGSAKELDIEYLESEIVVFLYAPKSEYTGNNTITEFGCDDVLVSETYELKKSQSDLAESLVQLLTKKIWLI